MQRLAGVLARLRSRGLLTDDEAVKLTAPTMVDSQEKLVALLEELHVLQITKIAVDCEGTILNRHGKLCLVTLAVEREDGSISSWVVDVLALGIDVAFDLPSAANLACSSLRQLLESPDIVKLMYDPRADSDAVYHQAGILMQKVLDLQILEVAYRRCVRRLHVEYVKGLASALEEYLPYGEEVPCSDKDKMHNLFKKNPQYWEQRPLRREALTYCASDVAYLFALDRKLQSGLEAHKKKVDKVWAISDARVRECMLPEAPAPGPERAKAPRI